MSPSLKRVVRIAFGWLLVVVGLVGIILPVLHGAIFLFGGLIVLSTEYAWAQRILDKIRTRFPRLARIISAAEQKIRNWGWIPAAPAQPAD